jgi:hypothetical protein
MSLFAAACALAASTAAQAADFAKIGPLAPAAGLVAARQVLQEPALELDYKVAGGTAPGEITVDLASNFTTLLQDTNIYIYDYTLARLIALDDKTHRFNNTSLYGIVDFWINETANRRYQRGLLGAMSVKSDTLDPFWVQSELHVIDAEDGTPAIERRKDKDGTVRFFYRGAEVASYAPSKQTLTAEEGARLARFLKAYASLHPTIVDDIVKSGAVPERLSFVSQPKGTKTETVWTLQSATEVKAAYPLYASARVPAPDLADVPAPVAALLPAMKAALAGQAPGKRSVEDFRAATQKALADGHALQAMLLVMESSEEYGQPDMNCTSGADCGMLKKVGDAVRADSRSRQLGAALQPAKDQLETAIKTLREMKRDDLSNAYMLDDFAANNLIAAGRSDEAIPLFAAAIKGNPAMAGFYKDMGDAYRAGFDPTTAWLLYDLGRALPGAADAKVISSITEYEAQLAKAHPEFF